MLIAPLEVSHQQKILNQGQLGFYPQKCGLIQAWNMSNGKDYKLLKNNGPSHADCVYALEANAASGILFSGGGGMQLNAPQSDPFIRAWKMKQDQSGFDLIGEMQGHTAGIKTLQIVQKL